MINTIPSWTATSGCISAYLMFQYCSYVCCECRHISWHSPDAPIFREAGSNHRGENRGGHGGREDTQQGGGGLLRHSVTQRKSPLDPCPPPLCRGCWRPPSRGWWHCPRPARPRPPPRRCSAQRRSCGSRILELASSALSHAACRFRYIIYTAHSHSH